MTELPLVEPICQNYRAILAAVSIQIRVQLMAKAYWISCYRKITDPARLAAYAKLAGPAIQAGGGRFLARATAAKAYEDGKAERTVLIEFDSVEQAIAVHDSPGYQAALAELEGGVVRDMRIVPGV
jgi:uncharacterized protein (DUF1330 family)